MVFFGDQLGEKKNNSVTVLILKIDKCLFEIKNQSLQKKKKERKKVQFHKRKKVRSKRSSLSLCKRGAG